MFLFLQPTQFHIQNIYFLEKKMNMIMDGFFTKFVWSTSFMTMMGLYFQLPPIATNYSNILTINMVCHKEWIHRLCVIEKQLLQYYQMFYAMNKTPIYSLKSQLQRGTLKYYRDIESGSPSTVFYLKISGIWENSHEIGITFKIIEYGRV
jgi:hypothetical protein